MKKLSALAFRKHFGSVLDRVARESVPIVVERASHPLVVLISYRDYEQERKRKEELQARAEGYQKLMKWKTKHAHAFQGFDVIAAVRKSREER